MSMLTDAMNPNLDVEYTNAVQSPIVAAVEASEERERRKNMVRMYNIGFALLFIFITYKLASKNRKILSIPFGVAGLYHAWLASSEDAGKAGFFSFNGLGILLPG